jgi:hypothetical protein
MDAAAFRYWQEVGQHHTDHLATFRNLVARFNNFERI